MYFKLPVIKSLTGTSRLMAYSLNQVGQTLAEQLCLAVSDPPCINYIIIPFITLGFQATWQNSKGGVTTSYHYANSSCVQHLNHNVCECMCVQVAWWGCIQGVSIKVVCLSAVVSVPVPVRQLSVCRLMCHDMSTVPQGIQTRR